MSLSSDQLEKLQKWMNNKGLNPTCPVCNENKWSTGDVISAPVFDKGGFQIGGPTVPMVQLICNNCAYVRLFAAVPIGLVD